MFCSLHPFRVGNYSGLVVATGLPRPSARKDLWKDVASEFDEILNKYISDSEGTKIPGVALISEGAEGALCLESARTHCLRRFQKDFQGSLRIGVYVQYRDHKCSGLLLLEHPALGFSLIDSQGYWTQLKIQSNETEPLWAFHPVELKNSWLLTAKNIDVKDTENFQEIVIGKDRCFRWGNFLADMQYTKIFSFFPEANR